jgi:hypothetical protein
MSFEEIDKNLISLGFEKEVSKSNLIIYADKYESYYFSVNFEVHYNLTLKKLDLYAVKDCQIACCGEQIGNNLKINMVKDLIIHYIRDYILDESVAYIFQEMYQIRQRVNKPLPCE